MLLGIWASLAVAIAALAVHKRARRYQPGTYQRYRLLSVRRMLSFTVIGISLAIAVGSAVTGDVFTMVGQTAVGCMWLWSDRLYRDDDDFFNRFRNRLRERRGARRARLATSAR